MSADTVLYSHLAIGLKGHILQPKEKQWLQHSAVKAVVFFTRNIASYDQLANLVKACRQAKPDCLFFIDHEGIDLTAPLPIRNGIWRAFKTEEENPLQSLDEIPPANSQYNIGQIKPLEAAVQAAFDSGKTIGSGLSALGIHPLAIVVDTNPKGYAPSPRPQPTNTQQQTVSDSSPGKNHQSMGQTHTALTPSAQTHNSDPHGWVIHGLGRSFGENIEILAKAKAQGIQSTGLARIFKHFPDHGMATDTHDFTKHCTDPRSHAELTEAIAVYQNLSDSLDMVMTNHVVYPNSPDPNTEAGLSAYWLNLLRSQLQPMSMILSDCLNMGAIRAKGWHTSQAISRASLPDPNQPHAITDLVLATQEDDYDELLASLDHQPIDINLKRLKHWFQQTQKAIVKAKTNHSSFRVESSDQV